MGLRAAGEPTRLRLLVLCAHSELSVSELVQIVGQSQPRVSRHLKLLVEAGLLMRFREGSQVFFRIADRNSGYAHLARTLVDLVSEDDDAMHRDLARLQTVRDRRAAEADVYFQTVASQWDEIRSLHVSEQEVESALLSLVGDFRVSDYLDIGTGTGKIVGLLAGCAERAVGVDSSRPMLKLARANLEKRQLRNAHVRLGDMYGLPFGDDSFDLVTLHLVLHYAQDPSSVFGEIARVLRPGGRLLLVDFASHDLEDLCASHHHVHRGFSDSYIEAQCDELALRCEVARKLPANPLTTVIWSVSKPAVEKSNTSGEYNDNSIWTH